MLLGDEFPPRFIWCDEYDTALDSGLRSVGFSFELPSDEEKDFFNNTSLRGIDSAATAAELDGEEEDDDDGGSGSGSGGKTVPGSGDRGDGGLLPHLKLS